MKKTVYPYIALGLGVCLLVTLLASSMVAPDGKPALPLLTLLIMSEFGFIVTAIGAVVGIIAVKASQRKLMLVLTSLACGAMAVRFMMLGIEFWPL